MVKVDFHTHTGDDPCDRIPYSTRDLIDRAAALGFGALAITLHDRQLAVDPLRDYAAQRGIVLIPGIERTISGRHVLLLNFREGAADVQTFEDVARLKREANGLVIAPHAFFPGPTCLHGLLDRHAALFDAIEWNGMFTAMVNFNKPAARWAAAHHKPLVGNGDVHRLEQLGTTYSLVDAAPDADAICAAVRDGRVSVVAQPHSALTAARIIADLLVADLFRAPGPYSRRALQERALST